MTQASLVDAKELIKQLQTRTFYQPGGPGRRRYFFGMDTGYHFIDSAELPVQGTIDPIYVPDPRRPDRFRLVSRTVSAPDLPSMTVVFHEQWGGIPRALMAPRCVFNMYEVHSRCGDLSDFYRGGEGYIVVYSGFQFEGNIDLGARTARDSDDPLMDSAPAKGVAIYPAGAISFGEKAASDVVVEVIDVVYGENVTCGDCGVENDGSQHIYAITRANVGSPSAPGQLVYSTDGGVIWTTASITGIGTAAEPRYVDIAGGVLFVGTDATTLFYTQLNADTGAPSTWSSVTLPVAMRDVYVQSPRAIYFAADSGRVYRTEDIAVAPSLVDSGATDNLLRIHGFAETIVAVGANGRVYRSINNGATWASLSAPAATSLQAVCVFGQKDIIVGGANGNVYRTRDGSTWETEALPVSGGQVFDIVGPTREVIWVAYQLSNVAYLVTSLDGGDTWGRSGFTWRIQNWPTFQKAGRIAAPIAADTAVAANYLAVAGLASGGADGFLVAGVPTIK
jgi:hypothetical protein